MRLKQITSLVLVLINMAFVSGCSLVIGIIASTYDEPASLEMTIESDPPGAEIFVNGKKVGTAPLKVTIEGLSKEHTVVFIKNGYQTKIESVSISPDTRTDKQYLSVIRPDGTSFQVADNTLNVVLKEEYTFP
jgi:hypothetical protein